MQGLYGVGMINRVASQVAVVMAICIVLNLGACGAKPEDNAGDPAVPVQARKVGDVSIVELKAFLEKQPKSSEGRFLLGKALLAQGHAVAAEVELSKADELRHDPNLVAPELAHALVASGQPGKALERYRSTQLTDPRADAELKVTLAGAAAATGQQALAETLLSEASKTVPELPRATMLRARLELAAGQADSALRRLDSLTGSTGPESANAWALKGEIQQSHFKNSDAALAAVQQALKVDPTHVAAHRSAILLLLARGDIAGASTQLQELERAKPNQAAARVLHAMVALAKKDYLAVREKVQPLLNASPNNAVLLELAGIAEFHLNSYDKAESLLSSALSRAPDLSTARQTLAQLYLRTGQADRVLETLAPILNSGKVPAAVVALAGQAHLLNGDAAQAQKLFDAGKAASPGVEHFKTGQAVARLAQNGGPAALAELEALARSSPEATADAALITHFMRKSDWTRALAAIDGLARKQPDAPAADLLRGHVLTARKDAKGARASYEAALKRDAKLLPALQGLSMLDIADGKFEQARQRLQSLVAERPADSRAQLALVQLMDRIGTPPEDVVAQLEQAIKANPTSHVVRLQHVNTLLRSGQVVAAKEAATLALAALPGNAELLHAQGRAFLAAGNYQQAMTAFNELVTKLPKSPQLQLDLASARIGLADFNAAERHLRQALALAPEMAAAQEALLAVLLRSGRHDAALSFARQVQQRQPASAIGHYFEGGVELQRQRWDAALAAYRQALRIEPSARSAVSLHTALLAANRGDEANRMADSWLVQHPAQVDFMAYLADQSARRGDLAGAETAYRELLRVQATHAGALNNLAWLLARQGKPGAVELAERARRAEPYNPAVQDTLALALAAEGQPKRALETQAKLVAQYPNNPDYRLQLAALLLQFGNKAKARDQLDLLTRLGDAYPRQREVAALKERT